MQFLLFFFVTLTTVVAEADERFGKAYLRWARPVAISEIKPDLREIREDFFYRNHKVATCFHCTARPASQAQVSKVVKKLAKDYCHHPLYLYNDNIDKNENVRQ